MIWSVLVATVLLAAATAILSARRRLVAVTIWGTSMEPSFRSGDRVLVRRIRASRLQQGDVVVCSASASQSRPFRATDRTRWVLKRVAALPGNTVPAVVVPAVSAGTVPPGQLVLLGDCAVVSVDSRTAGFYSLDRVLGRVIRKV